MLRSFPVIRKDVTTLQSCGGSFHSSGKWKMT